MKTARGFTLVEIVVVLFIVGIVLTMAFTLTRAFQASAQSSASARALQAVQDALRNYAMTSRSLPCPADGALSTGLEVRAGGACNNEVHGVVPWTTLGLKESEVLDGYGTRITYRVDPALAAPGALLMAGCDPAGAAAADPAQPGGCSAACTDQGVNVPAVCTSPVAAIGGKGLVVKASTTDPLNLADPVGAPPSGAAYVLISHGANHAGGYGTSGVLQDAVGPVGPGEAQNSAASPLQAFYVDASDDVTPATHFDDVIARESVVSLVNRSGLGPRIHRPPGS